MLLVLVSFVYFTCNGHVIKKNTNILNIYYIYLYIIYLYIISLYIYIPYLYPIW